MKKSWLEILSTVAAAIAVFISIYALQAQRKLEHETSAQTLIHDQYELCRVLDQMRVENPEVSHVLALPVVDKKGKEAWQNYYDFKAKVRRLFDDDKAASPGEQARLYLKEHAMALHVFDIYEQTRFQAQLAAKAEDDTRLQILNSLVQYYEQRMLRNPRLRYHWERGGSDMMELETRQAFDKQVKAAFPDDPVDDKSPIETAKETTRI